MIDKKIRFNHPYINGEWRSEIMILEGIVIDKIIINKNTAYLVMSDSGNTNIAYPEHITKIL